MRQPGENPQDDRSSTTGDYTPESLKAWAANNFPRVRMGMFINSSNQILRPGSLKGAFTHSESQMMQHGRRQVAAFEEVTDLSEAVTVRTPYLQRNGFNHPSSANRVFDLSMSVSHMTDPLSGVIEASPANIINVHHEVFNCDAETQALKDYITFGPYESGSPTSLVLEIPGSLPDEDLEFLNAFLAELKDSGINYSAKFERPQLGHALQSAISRSYSPHLGKPSTIVTTALGPKGLPIAVHSGYMGGVLLEEGLSRGSHATPTNTFLVRPHFEAL